MNHRPRKRFGQNFLTDRNIIDNIIGCIAPRPSDHMVEIGPGLGALTIPLLEILDHLEVIELDRDIIPQLLDTCRRHVPPLDDRLVIHEIDVLKFDFLSLHESPDESGKLRVIGNLPYNISTPILFHLLKYRHIIGDMHFMLQKEVVARICSAPRSKQYGRLSVMLQAYCSAESLFDVPPGAFQPPPKVTSAILRLTPVAAAAGESVDFEQLEKLVRTAFAQRRKTLRNTLRSLCSAETIEQAGFDPGARAEELSVEDYVHLCRQISGDGMSAG